MVQDAARLSSRCSGIPAALNASAEAIQHRFSESLDHWHHDGLGQPAMPVAKTDFYRRAVCSVNLLLRASVLSSTVHVVEDD